MIIRANAWGLERMVKEYRGGALGSE